MLKWTASAQKLNTDSPIGLPQRRERGIERTERRRRARRATIANKENVPYATSTPMVPRTTMHRATRNSSLADILNITPNTSSPTTSDVRNRTLTPNEFRVSTALTSSIDADDATLRPRPPQKHNNLISSRSRRHSTIGITLPSAVPLYACTLPRFQVEEYSPSTSPTGQQLALRGLLPDPFLSNARYFQTPDPQKQRRPSLLKTKSQLKKRNLDIEFVAEESEGKQPNEPPNDTIGMSSSKMGNETLDKLIDAILDSARKDIKKKKNRKSFNLRRRTLLKTHNEAMENVVLSPSYAAGDDPASDLNFPSHPLDYAENVSTVATKSLAKTSASAITPAPVTPPPGTPPSQSILCQMPTPTTAAMNVSTTTFKLETPVRTHARKRRQTQFFDADAGAVAQPNRTKKFKVDARNYFEIGVALPSIYV